MVDGIREELHCLCICVEPVTKDDKADFRKAWVILAVRQRRCCIFLHRYWHSYLNKDLADLKTILHAGLELNS